jgi:hypothetical protein
MKLAGSRSSKLLVSLIVLQIAQSSFFSNVANAATAGSGVCQQTYTVTGTGELAVYESGGYCYIAFKNTGVVNTQAIFSWTRPASALNVDVLVVGGGGGGGARHGGGGGAGGFVQTNAYTISTASSIAIAVGAGGGASTSFTGTSGQNSYFKPTTGSSSGLIAIGGGYGANGTAAPGGSGGGAGAGQTVGQVTAQTQSTFAGVTLAGISFGSAGKPGATEPNDAGDNNDYWAGGGGGGAAGQGTSPLSNGVETIAFLTNTSSTARGGSGGDGKSVSWLTPTVASNLSVGHTSSGAVYFAGGGGGGMGVDGLSGGAGGLGGGATGTRTDASGNAGTAFTGGGGGGSGFDDISKAGSTQTVSAAVAGAGGSGVVVIRYIWDVTAPTISTFSITSSSGSDNIYALGDTVTLTIGWSETVTVTGTPRVQVQGLTSKYLNYSSGSGTLITLFTYIVVSGDLDRDGFSISANSLALNSGTIRDAVGNDATLTHSAISATIALQIDGVLPTLASAAISSDGTRLTLTFSETLSSTFSSYTAITLMVGSTRDVLSNGTAADSRLSMSLTFSALSGSAVTLSYADPTSGNDVNALQDEAGNDVATFSNFSVTNSSTLSTNTTANIALNPASTTAVFRAVTTIRVTTNTGGRVDFYQSGKIIPNCRNIATSADIANCSWRPMFQNYVNLTARFRPTGAGFQVSQSDVLQIYVIRRAGLR